MRTVPVAAVPVSTTTWAGLYPRQEDPAQRPETPEPPHLR